MSKFNSIINTITAYPWVSMVLVALLATGCEEDDSLVDVPGEEIVRPIAPAEPPEGFTNEFAEVNGVRLQYVIGGQGEPLVLLHGWPQNWYEWHRIMPALARNYTVIVPTLRGVGDSDKPSGTDNYTKRVMAEDVRQLVQQLGHTSVKIAAHDIGAMVAYAYAALYRDEVEKLAVLDAPLPGIEPFWTDLLTRPDLLLWHFGLNQTEGSEELVINNERAYLLRMYTDFAANPEAFTEAEVDEFERAYRGRAALRGGFEWYRAFPQDVEDNQQFAQTPLTIPVLALGGEFSLGAAAVPQMQAVAEPDQVTGGSIAGTGHWLLEEQSDLVLSELTEFFAD